MNDETADLFHDAIALSRAITSGDAAGAEALINEWPVAKVLDISVAMSWLLGAAVARLAEAQGRTRNEEWLNLITIIDISDDMHGGKDDSQD